MPAWKQLITVSTSLCVGGIAGALVVAAPTTLPTITPAGGLPHMVFAPLDLLPYGAVAAMFTVPAALIFGLPAFFLLKKFRALNIFSVAFVGIIASSIVLAALFISGGFNSDLWYLLAVGPVAAIAAFLMMSNLKMSA